MSRWHCYTIFLKKKRKENNIHAGLFGFWINIVCIIYSNHNIKQNLLLPSVVISTHDLLTGISSLSAHSALSRDIHIDLSSLVSTSRTATVILHTVAYIYIILYAFCANPWISILLINKLVN